MQARLDRLTELMTSHSQSPDDYDRDCEEDVGMYFDGEKDPAVWCVVTRHDSTVYFYPAYDDFFEAARRALEYITDGDFMESPMKIVNLDTGSVFRPDFDAVKWWDDARD